MIMDFDDLSKIVREKVIFPLDHTFLNDLIPLSTAENISVWIWAAAQARTARAGPDWNSSRPPTTA